MDPTTSTMMRAFISADALDLGLEPREGMSQTIDAFVIAGAVPPYSDFLISVLRYYEIRLAHLTPVSIVILSVFAHLCVHWLGEEPTLDLFRQYYHCRIVAPQTTAEIGSCCFRLREDRSTEFIHIPYHRKNLRRRKSKRLYIQDGSGLDETAVPSAPAVQRPSWDAEAPDDNPDLRERVAKLQRTGLTGAKVMLHALKHRLAPLQRRDDTSIFPGEADLQDQTHVKPCMIKLFGEEIAEMTMAEDEEDVVIGELDDEDDQEGHKDSFGHEGGQEEGQDKQGDNEDDFGQEGDDAGADLLGLDFLQAVKEEYQQLLRFGEDLVEPIGPQQVNQPRVRGLRLANDSDEDDKVRIYSSRVKNDLREIQALLQETPIKERCVALYIEMALKEWPQYFKEALPGDLTELLQDLKKLHERLTGNRVALDECYFKDEKARAQKTLTILEDGRRKVEQELLQVLKTELGKRQRSVYELGLKDRTCEEVIQVYDEEIQRLQSQCQKKRKLREKKRKQQEEFRILKAAEEERVASGERAVQNIASGIQKLEGRRDAIASRVDLLTSQLLQVVDAGPADVAAVLAYQV